MIELSLEWNSARRVVNGGRLLAAVVPCLLRRQRSRVVKERLHSFVPHTDDESYMHHSNIDHNMVGLSVSRAEASNERVMDPCAYFKDP